MGSLSPHSYRVNTRNTIRGQGHECQTWRAIFFFFLPSSAGGPKLQKQPGLFDPSGLCVRMECPSLLSSTPCSIHLPVAKSTAIRILLLPQHHWKCWPLPASWCHGFCSSTPSLYPSLLSILGQLSLLSPIPVMTSQHWRPPELRTSPSLLLSPL